jgi:hypothetical protein
MTGLGYVIFDKNWKRIELRSFNSWAGFRDIQADKAIRFEGEDKKENKIQISILISENDMERLIDELKEIVNGKETHKIFIPATGFEQGKDVGMVFKFSGLAIKGVPNFYAVDVIKDYGETVRIKFDFGKEQILWFIPKGDLRELRELLTNCDKTSEMIKKRIEELEESNRRDSITLNRKTISSLKREYLSERMICREASIQELKRLLEVVK